MSSMEDPETGPVTTDYVLEENRVTRRKATFQKSYFLAEERNRKFATGQNAIPPFRQFNLVLLSIGAIVGAAFLFVYALPILNEGIYADHYDNAKRYSILGGALVLIAIRTVFIAYRSIAYDRRFILSGVLITGALNKIRVHPDYHKKGYYVVINFSFMDPSTHKVIRAEVTLNRPDLRKKPFPAAKTRVCIYFLDSDHYRML